MTNRARARMAQQWLYRGVCVRILKDEFGNDIVDLIRSLADDKVIGKFYESNIVEALIINNVDPDITITRSM